MNFPIYIYIIALTAGVCLFSIKKNPPLLKPILLFLVFTLLLEIAGFELKKLQIRNHWLYNIFIIVEFNFWLFIYHQAIYDKRIKIAIRLFFISFALFTALNLLVFQGMLVFNTYTYIVGAIAIIVLNIIYFKQLLTNEATLNLTTDLLFWVSSGLLFYYLGNVPFYGMINYLNEYYMEIARKYFPIIVPILIVTKHILFTIGFSCVPRIQKS